MDDWKEVTISRDSTVATTRHTREENAVDHDSAVHIADLARKGSIVAVAAEDDPISEYYLFKFTSKGVKELENDILDDYGFTVLTGESSPNGQFYLRLNLHDMTFMLNEKKVAVIYAATVRHICCELENRRNGRKIVYKLPVNENEESMASLYLT